MTFDIVRFRPELGQAFKDLNLEWIEEYFIPEESDYKSLNDPQGYVIDKGGEIFFALYDGEPIGVCALAKSAYPEYDFELSKMGVRKEFQSKGVGKMLSKKVIEEARLRGGKTIFLESNTSLIPALKLYEKLGFKKIENFVSEYARSDIQMVLHL